jgi:hypothetical protein
VLRGFCFVVSGLTGMTVAAALAGWLGEARWMSAGLVVFVALGTFLFLWEPGAWRLYHGWNRWLVRPYTAWAGQVVMRLCYFIIFAAVGRAGSRLPLAQGHAGGSGWSDRQSLPASAYRVPGPGFSNRLEWIRGYLAWSFRSGNAWSAALLPFITVLWMCSGGQEEKPEANIYTLF